MRIISGKYRGRRIQPPKGLPARPTMDQAKEALFNILENQLDLQGITVLDAFSGTGNMSYEFLSRGAARIVAVEKHGKSAGFIRSMFRELDHAQAKVIKMPVERFLKMEGQPFDLIFMDPPYDYPDMAGLVQSVFAHKLLNPDGLLVLEHRNTSHFEALPQWETTRNYGTSCFSFFRGLT